MSASDDALILAADLQDTLAKAKLLSERLKPLFERNREVMHVVSAIGSYVGTAQRYSETLTSALTLDDSPPPPPPPPPSERRKLDTSSPT